MYTNAQSSVISSSGIDKYIAGELVAYKCDDGFSLDPPIPSWGCVCKDNLNSTASWSCISPETTAACKPSEKLGVLFYVKAEIGIFAVCLNYGISAAGDQKWARGQLKYDEFPVL